MSNIKKAFENKKAFIAFITCGDPSLEVTEKLIHTLVESGVDLIELGIPFSDPTAEGPVIMGADERALKNGTTTDKIFELVERIRKDIPVPMVFMTYANVIFSYDSEKFISRAAAAGMDGLILPDIPYEEKDEFDGICKKHNMDLVSLIAPTSKDRIKMIASDANGFLYCVSSLGVTGARSDIKTDIASMISLVREASDIPCAVGFGISTPEQAKKMASVADGAIVGSAIVKLCEQHGADCVPYVREYVKSLADAIHSV